MAIEKPYNGRVSFEEEINGITLINPVKRNYFILAFMIFWLCGWVMGEVFAIRTLITGDTPFGANLFMIGWLGAWTLGGGFVISIVFWQLKGRELIEFKSGVLTLKKEGALFYKQKSYDINEINHFKYDASAKINHPFFSSNRGFQDMIPFKQVGNISFSYGMKTISFGAGVDEPEVNYILKTLVEKEIVKQEQLA